MTGDRSRQLQQIEAAIQEHCAEEMAEQHAKVASVRGVVHAWIAGDACDVPVGRRWLRAVTDGASVWIDQECLLTRQPGPGRLPDRRPVLVNGRRYAATSTRAFAAAVIEETLVTEEILFVRVASHFWSSSIDPEALVRGYAYQQRVAAFAADEHYLDEIVGPIVDAWLIGRDSHWRRDGVSIATADGHVFAGAECLMTRVPRQRITLLSGRRYRPGTLNYLVRDALRLALSVRRIAVQEVRASHSYAMPDHLHAAWALLELGVG